MTVKISVIIATYNRSEPLLRLLGQLARQTVPANEFEAVVVDDGSRENVPSLVDTTRFPYKLQVVRQANAGPAAARNHAIGLASGELLVVIDDDMQVPEAFLAAHLAMHPAGTRRAVIGRLRPDSNVDDMPYFAKWYARGMDRLGEQVKRGEAHLDGTNVYTGNLSLRRADYLAVGGFDLSLRLGEDTELGLRLQRSGVEVHLSNDAWSIHSNDHTSEEEWLERAHRYGRNYRQIGEKHAQMSNAGVWRFLFSNHPLSRVLLAASIVSPRGSRPLSSAVLAATKLADRLGLSRLADAGTSVAYTMEYHRGAREAAGPLTTTAREVWREWSSHRGR